MKRFLKNFPSHNLFRLSLVAICFLSLSACAAASLVQSLPLWFMAVTVSLGLMSCRENHGSSSSSAIVPAPSCSPANPKALFFDSPQTIDALNSPGTIDATTPTFVTMSSIPSSNVPLSVTGAPGQTAKIFLDSETADAGVSHASWPFQGNSSRALVLSLDANPAQIFAYDYIPEIDDVWGDIGSGAKQIVMASTAPTANLPVQGDNPFVDVTSHAGVAAGDVIVIGKESATGLYLKLDPSIHKIGLADGLTFADLSFSAVQGGYTISYNGHDLLTAVGIVSMPTTANFTEGYLSCYNDPHRDLKTFVTPSSGQHDGNLGGVSGADAKCETASNHPNDGHIYKALLALDNTRCNANCANGAVDWPLAPKTRYLRADATTEVGITSGNGTFPFPLANSVGGATIINAYTGLTTEWADAADNCSAWTSNSVAQQGAYGTTNQTDDKAINDPSSGPNGTTCDNVLSLICVEQK